MEYNTNDLSKILDVSTNTIRRFEGKGYLSSDRDEQNGYGKFCPTDVEKLMYIAKYRKVGFSHEEIPFIMQEDLNTIKERFKVRKAELDEEIAHLQALSHMLKDDIMLMDRVEEYGTDVVEYKCSPFHYVIYRNKGELCTKGEQAKVLHHFMSTCTEFEYLYLFDREDLEARRMVFSEGVGANQRCTQKYGVQLSPRVLSYEKQPCLIRFMRIPLDFQTVADETPGELFSDIFAPFWEYMALHDLEMNGDAIALKLGYSKEDGKEWQYILMHLAIKPKGEKSDL